MSDLHETVEVLRECARRTDDINKRMVCVFRFQTIAFAVAAVLITFIAFAYAFSTPYPEQYQTIDGFTQQQGGLIK